jgi:hypothetical protein
VRGRSRWHVLGHFEALLSLAKSLGGGRLGSRVALVLGYEVLEDTDIIPSITLVGRIVGSLRAQDRVHHELMAMQLGVLLLRCATRIREVPSEFTM